jgi:uncharacterized membrane protein (UPF0127 family)
MRPIIKLISYFIVLTFFLQSSSQDIQFKKTKIKISEKTITVELAQSDAEQMRGLMFRRSLKDEEGMLFVYPDENIRGFWMKNTFIPLSIGFFDSKGRLIDIQDMEPVKSTIEVQPRSYTSKGNAKYALEVNKGWFDKYKIKLGDTLTILPELK